MIRDLNRAMNQLDSTPKFGIDKMFKIGNGKQLQKCVEKIEKYVKKTKEEILIKNTAVEKILQFREYLKKVELYGKQLAELLEKNLFEKYRLFSMKEEEMNNCYRNEATVFIDSLKLDFVCSFDYGALDWYWTIETSYGELADKIDGSVSVSLTTLQTIGEFLNISLEKRDEGIKLLIEALMMLFPWDEDYSSYEEVDFN